MQSYLLDLANKLVADYGTHAIAIIAGFIVFVMLLGSLKRITSKLFTFALDAGEKVANHLIAKPKAVILAVILAAVAIPSFVAGWRLAPVQVVEKPVHVTVPDLGALAVKDSEIRELKGVLASTTGEQSSAVNQSVELSNKLASAEGQIRSLGDRLGVLANEKAELEGKLAPFLQPAQDQLASIEAVKARTEEVNVTSKAERHAWEEIVQTLMKTNHGEHYDRLAVLRDESRRRTNQLSNERVELDVRLKELEAEQRRITAKLPPDKESKPKEETLDVTTRPRRPRGN